MRHTVLAIREGEGELRHVAGPPSPSRPRQTFDMVWTNRSLLGSRAASGDGLRREIVWSGSYAEVDGGGMFDEDPRTWGPRAWDELGARVGREVYGGVVIRPHAKHVVSDVPGCRRLIESDWAIARDVHLCYEPAGMMTIGMLARAEDHLRRMYEAIELMPSERLAMVVVGGLDGKGAPCGVDCCGEFGRIIAELVAAWVPEGVLLAMYDERIGEQIGMMERAGG